MGDVTGDGLADLTMGAHIHGDRVGALYMVAGRPRRGARAAESGRHGPAADLPVQLVGSYTGEAVGSGAVGGDIDGDGQQDLVIGPQACPPPEGLARALAAHLR